MDQKNQVKCGKSISWTVKGSGLLFKLKKKNSELKSFFESFQNTMILKILRISKFWKFHLINKNVFQNGKSLKKKLKKVKLMSSFYFLGFFFFSLLYCTHRTSHEWCQRPTNRPIKRHLHTGMFDPPSLWKVLARGNQTV